MAKVITGKGLNEFISSGTIETVKPDPQAKVQKEAPALEVKNDKPINDIGDKNGTEPPKDDEGLEGDELTYTEQVKKQIGKRVYKQRQAEAAAKAAEEKAAEAERFAENQYNRARLAEERAAALEAQMKVAKPDVTADTAKTKPDPLKFYDDKGQFKAFEYAEELAAWSSKSAIAEYESKQVKARQEAERLAQEENVRARVAQASAKYPDFNEVMAAQDVKTHNDVLTYLSASDYIAEVSYYLAKHPDYVERINKLHPLKAIAEIGKLEATFEPTKAKVDEKLPEVTSKKVNPGAPAPITPLNSQGSVNTNTDPSKMSFKELRAYERTRAKKH